MMMRLRDILLILAMCCVLMREWSLYKSQPEFLPLESTAESTAARSEFSAFHFKTLPKKEGYGVVYSAYSLETNKSLPRFLAEVITSARQIKSNNPQISVSLITNANSHQVPNDAFDHIIPVSEALLFRPVSTRADGISRQWFSRLYYLAHSPYQVTWYLDSHAAVPTTRLLEAFEAFDQSDIDIATGNQSPNGFNCHNFALLFKWSERVEHVFLDWLLKQLSRGVDTDDQLPLCMALGCSSSGVKYGAIAPEWALAWLSLNPGKEKQWWRHRTTQIFHSSPHICHSSDLCNLITNVTKRQPLLMYMDASAGTKSARLVESQSEIDGILPYKFTWDGFRASTWNSSSDRLSPADVVIPKHWPCRLSHGATMIQVLSLQNLSGS